MNNVNDLQHQNSSNIGPKGDNHSIVREPRQKAQNVSLSYLKGDEPTQSINIDAINMPREEHHQDQKQEEFHINNMPRKKPMARRTMQNMNIVDPSEVTASLSTEDEKAQKPTDKVLSESFTALDTAVRRKKQEYHDFVDRAVEADKVNRDRIANGIEEAPTEEILYRLSDVDPERAQKEEDIPTRAASDQGAITSNGEYIDDVEKDLEDELNNDYYYDGNSYEQDDVKANTVIGNSITANESPYYDDKSESVEEDSYEEDNNESNVDSDYKFDDIEIKDSVQPRESVSVNVTHEEESPKVIENEVPKASNGVLENTGFRFIQSDPEINNPLKDAKPLDSSSVDIDERDFDDIDLEEESLDNDTSTEEAAINAMSEEERIELLRQSREHLRSEVLEKIVDAGKKYNTASIKVSNKVVSIKDALAANKHKEVQRGKFALMRAGRPIVFSAFSGLEIATLSNEAQRIQEGDRGYELYGVGISPRMAEILYKHDMNPNKPASVKSWTKTIPALDADNLFGAVYLASLSGSNFMPRVCDNPTCRYSFLEEMNDIKSFFKFGNKVSEEKYNKIIKMPDYDGDSSSYETVIQIINDRYAIGIRDIPLHFFVYELSSLNAEFIDKYSTIINIVAMIDAMYLITTDENGNAQLNKIGYKQYPADEAKNLKSKVIAYAKIFQEFNDTDFAVLNAYIQILSNNIDDRSNLSWYVPETKCPKCGRTISGIENFAASALVFTKQRLVESVITPTER